MKLRYKIHSLRSMAWTLLLVVGGLISALLAGIGFAGQPILIGLTSIIWGAVLFLVLTKQLSFLLMQTTIFVSLTLGWGFQTGLSPFSLFGWGITYNDMLIVLCIMNWGLHVVSGSANWPKKELVKPLIFFLIYMLIPILYTMNFDQEHIWRIPPTVGYLLYYVLLLPFCHALKDVKEIGRLVKIFLIAIISAGIVTALYNQGILYLPYPHAGRGFNTVRTQNVLQGVMVTGFFFSLSLLQFWRGQRIVRLLAWLALASSIIMILLSQGRTLVLIALPAGLISFLFTIRLRYRIEGVEWSFGRTALRGLIILLIVVFLSVIFSIRFRESSQAFFLRLSEISNPTQAGSITTRVKGLRLLTPYVLERNPITGLGIGATHMELKAQYGMDSSSGVHNIWLYLFSRAGIFGVLFFLNYQYSILRTVYRLIVNARDPKFVALASGMFSSMVAVLGVSTIYTPESLTEGMTIVYCMFFAILNTIIGEKNGKNL